MLSRNVGKYQYTLRKIPEERLSRLPGFLPAVKAAGGVKFTTHLPLVSRLRMHGLVVAFLLYAFVAQTWSTFSL